MHYKEAADYSQELKCMGSCTVRFVNPITAVMLPACWIAEEARPQVNFANDSAEGYARNIGMIDALEERPVCATRGWLCGKSYTPLASLSTHEEVEACNATISSVIYGELSEHGQDLARAFAKIVGELHDNVASHSWGKGFSAAQIYGRGSGRRLSFAIADNGRGLLRNAQRVRPEITTSHAAIEWAFQRETTSWKPPDPWSQRGLDDRFDGASTGDHHAGLGLWELAELVKETKGSAWVATGDAQMVLRNGVWERVDASGLDWDGLAIEVEIPVRPTPGSRKTPRPPVGGGLDFL